MTQTKDIVEQKKFRDKKSGQKVSWREKQRPRKRRTREMSGAEGQLDRG